MRVPGKKNESSEFEQLAFQYIDALYSTALRITRNKQDAEDLVQDTFLKGFKSFHRFEKGTNFKAWIFKILMNTFINKYHKDLRNPASVEFEKVEFFVEEPLSREERPSMVTDRNQFLSMFDDQIVQAIEQMPEDYRICVLLCDIEHFSYQEISDLLQIPIGTVMSRIFRGRKLLQTLLADYARREGYLKQIPVEIAVN